MGLLDEVEASFLSTSPRHRSRLLSLTLHMHDHDTVRFVIRTIKLETLISVLNFDLKDASKLSQANLGLLPFLIAPAFA